MRLFSSKFKNTVSIVLLSVLIAVPMPRVCEAWTTFAAMTYKQGLEQAYDNLMNMLLAKGKQVLQKEINDRMRKLAAGTTGQPKVISDYKDFIFGSSRRKTNEFVTDFFRKKQAGGVSPEMRDELRTAEKAIQNELEPPETDVDQFERRIDSPRPKADVLNQVAGGGEEEYLEMQTRGSHPFSMFIKAREKAVGMLEQEQEVKKAKAVAGAGFDTTIEGNKVVPGAVMKDLLAKAEAMPIELVNNATSWVEVTAVAATASLSSFAKTGINVVARPIENQIRSIARTNANGVKDVLKRVYQGTNH